MGEVSSSVLGAFDMAPLATGVFLFDGKTGKPIFHCTVKPPVALAFPERKIRWSAGIIGVILDSFGVTEAAVEDYAYAARGSGQYTVMEHGGVVKQEFLSRRIPIYKYSISTIKKFATEDGGADKEKMAREFKSLTRIRKTELLLLDKEKHNVGSSIFDEHEIDAYFIGRLHLSRAKRKPRLKRRES